MSQQRLRIWDLPTRLFHWLLVALVTASFVSGQIGGNLMVWHGRCGLAILGLLAFRLVWGVVGSTYARFASFFPTPASVTAYLRGEWRGPGHNPLGAFSVFGLLGLLAFQVGTGLFANDDIAFQGPLYVLINGDLSDTLSGLHRLSSDLLVVLVVLHLGAIGFYAHVKKDNLVKPMITGWKDADPAQGAPATGGGPLALLLALLLAVAAVYLGSGSWLPPPPPAPASAPAW